MAKKVVIGVVVVVVVVVVIIAKAFGNPAEYAGPQQKISSGKLSSLIKGNCIASYGPKAPIRIQDLIDPNLKQIPQASEKTIGISRTKTDAEIGKLNTPRLLEGYGATLPGPNIIQ